MDELFLNKEEKILKSQIIVDENELVLPKGQDQISIFLNEFCEEFYKLEIIKHFTKI
jgi:hypothetical protein